MRQFNSKKRKTSHEEPDGDVYTAKPTALFTPTGGRKHTLSIAIPGSIVANTPSVEQKSHLVGTIARALAVFCVDEVVVFEDGVDNGDNGDDNSRSSNGFTAFSDPSHFLSHVLSYIETPPYLRKHLFPMHPNLRTAGTLPSLDMPHHLRQNEWCDYREGVVVSSQGGGGGSSNSDGKGRKTNKDDAYKNTTDNLNNSNKNNGETIVDTGLPQKVVLRDTQLPQQSRVTIHFSSQDQNAEAEFVDRSAPRKDAGYYWGYQVRRCHSLSSVFTECPFDGGYDLSFGTSERGVPLSDVVDRRPDRGETGSGNCYSDGGGIKSFPDYKHLLIVFGGVAGLETAVRNDRQLRDMGIRPVDAEKLFDHWVNLLPGQGSRTIRTEEAVWLGLTSLRRLVERRDRRQNRHRQLDVSGSGQVDEKDNGVGNEHEEERKKKKKNKDKMRRHEN